MANSVLAQGRNLTVAPTVADGQTTDLQVDTAGNLKTTGSLGTVAAIGLGDSSDGVGTSATANKQGVVSRNTLFNNSSWDRVRSAINATNSIGTGIQAVGILAQFDDVSPTAITENQFGNVRMNSARALYNENGPYAYDRRTADGQVKGSAGFIHTITIAPIGSVTAGVLSIYDSLTETGTVIFSVSLPVTTFTPFTVTLDVPTPTGIFVGFDATLANVGVTTSFR